MVARIIDHPLTSLDIGPIPTPYNPDPALLAIVEVIRDGLTRDQHVRLHNFGTFRLRWSKERQIKHPKTGASVRVPPIPKITFTPAKHLRGLIDPDRKAPIPLSEPANNQVRREEQEKTQQIQQIPSATIYQFKTKDNKSNDQPNLTETVQDIIDENYDSDIQQSINTCSSQDKELKQKQRLNKKWAIGLLAAVPLILTLLQADFSEENNPAKTQVEDTTSDDSKSSTTKHGHNFQSIAAQKDNETVIPAPPGEKTKHNSNDKPLHTARSEPTSKPFYMSPQLHTILKGENLWKLADRFYGDPLLWPHIYRANMRTLSDPDIISTGKQLVIPGLQQAPDNLSGKDKALIAEGYFEIYKLNRTKNQTQAIYFLIGARQFDAEWLAKMKSSIPSKDWRIIENNK